MIYRVVTIVYVFLITSNVLAMPIGQDTLGGARYVQVALRNLKETGQGHFTNTFGDALPLVREEVSRGIPFIRLHLMWKDNHNFTKQDFLLIKKEAERFCPTVRNNPQIKWYFSGACEHLLNEALARELARIVLDACPSVVYVNTPMKGGAILKEFINEFHGTEASPKSPKFAFSFDGSAATDANVEALKKRFEGAEYFMLWDSRYNGRWEGNDNTPRPQRKGWPDDKFMASMHYLATDKGVTSLPKNWLWKSHAENKGNGDVRAEKPVAIIPVQTKKLDLKKNGKVVGVMPYYGKFTDGKHRYYASKWGYELGMVDIFIGSKKHGTVNAGFRDGNYR